MERLQNIKWFFTDAKKVKHESDYAENESKHRYENKTKERNHHARNYGNEDTENYGKINKTIEIELKIDDEKTARNGKDFLVEDKNKQGNAYEKKATHEECNENGKKVKDVKDLAENKGKDGNQITHIATLNIL